MKYRLFILLILTAILFNFTACKSENESYVFKTVIYGNPKTLDPQCSRQDSSYSVIYNIFQGLFAYDENGKIVNGMTEGYTVSEDGLVWTFNLKKNVKWSDGGDFEAECTADDYVFAFRRLLKPSTKSERAGEYYIIKNAELINEGTITDLNKLGVTAKDEYTLEIVLEKPCTDFKSLMALPPAMPCNKEFYEQTQGRYGLAADCIASNSNFYVHTWSYDEWSTENNYFILRRNPKNEAASDLPTGINLFIDPIDEFGDFENEMFHTYITSDSQKAKSLMSEYRYSVHSTDTWGIIFNLSGSFSELDYRVHLASFIENDNINGIIPDCVSIGDYDYRELAGNTDKSVFSRDSKVGVLSSSRFIIPENVDSSIIIGDILQNWQSECGFYCNIYSLDNSAYFEALSSGNFDIALIKLSGEYNSPYAYLDDFLEGNALNYSRFASRKFSHILNSAFTAGDEKSAAAYYKEAEQLLYDNAVFVPLHLDTKYVFYAEKAENVWLEPFSGVFRCTKNE